MHDDVRTTVLLGLVLALSAVAVVVWVLAGSALYGFVA